MVPVAHSVDAISSSQVPQIAETVELGWAWLSLTADLGSTVFVTRVNLPVVEGRTSCARLQQLMGLAVDWSWGQR